jgi:hypothetical protein
MGHEQLGAIWVPLELACFTDHAVEDEVTTVSWIGYGTGDDPFTYMSFRDSLCWVDVR